MPSLKEFRTDQRAIRDGTWERVNEAYGELDILVRGYTDGFHDARTARMVDAALPYGGDQQRIPNGQQRLINASLMEEFLIIGVRNLVDDDGRPVELEEFHKLLYMPDYAKLSKMCWDAAARVTNRTISQIEAAAKNSATVSDSTSITDHSAAA